MNDPASISKFLNRDIYIGRYTWTVGSNIAQQIDIWDLWQADSRVKQKLSHFTYFSGNLVVTARINGSPFQYGRLMFSYCPYFADQAGGSWFSTSNRNQIAACAYGAIVAAGSVHGKREVGFRHFSTYATAWMDPCTSDTIEINVPFVWHNNALSVCGESGTTRESLGQLLVFDAVPLRVCNDNAPTSAEYVVYARMEDIKLAVPTEYAPASSEYQTDVKEVAPTSDFAGITNVPVIGKMVKASGLAAGAVRDIGKVFGFSKPERIDESKEVDLALTGNFANTSGCDTAESLAMDPKQECVIDPTVTGVSNVDEMAFKNIVTKEQFLTLANWSATNGQNSTNLIYFALVSPNIPTKTYNATINHNSVQWQPSCDTPGGMVANMFSYWKGSITFRIQVVCSKLHSGRLLIQFDPFQTSGSIVAADLTTTDVNARYSQVLDLSESNECEFTINYVNKRPWLQTLQEIENYHWPESPSSTGTQLTNCLGRFDPNVHMGIFTVNVLNELVGPMDTTAAAQSVDVMIFMKCGDDMTFAQPEESPGNDSSNHPHWGNYIYVPRGGVVTCCGKREEKVEEHVFMFRPSASITTSTEIETPQMTILNKLSSENDGVFFGESVMSLRTMGKRYVGYSYYKKNDAAAGTANQGYIRNIPHFNPTAHLGSVSPTPKARQHTCESYFSPWFICRRGAMRKRLYFCSAVSNTVPIGELCMIERRASRSATDMIVGSTTPAAFDGMTSAQMMTNFVHGYNGMTMRDPNYRRFIEIQMPWYSNTRFDLAAHPYQIDDTGNEQMNISPSMYQTLYAQFVNIGREADGDYAYFEFSSIGDDYMVSCFTGIPLVWNEKGAVP
ncbi:hypothetical protein 2 [Wenzhou picorna-like virus 21]|uniref:hypothetical protein 2 n=1 Tax=Wenzhou picorna-like virus 21 TaxID=1923606 RepID=UPI00090A0466|nr:hypothetical protein 2 [Wenzhou picorna-like virus 21]APG78542.1 hypothetical protein 2 [Wenzhou picorna-like virus 21]